MAGADHRSPSRLHLLGALNSTRRRARAAFLEPRPQRSAARGIGAPAGPCRLWEMRQTHVDPLSRGRQAKPRYICRREGIDKGLPVCQSVPGTAVDAAVAELALELVRPQMLELALSAQDELQRALTRPTRCGPRRCGDWKRRSSWRSDAIGWPIPPTAGGRRARGRVERPPAASAGCVGGTGTPARARRTERTPAERIRSLATEFPRIWNDPATPVKERAHARPPDRRRDPGEGR